MIDTLLENCRLHGVEPYTHFKDVLARLPSTTHQAVAPLTPLQWQRARQSAARQAA